jgi:SAM-dependent methyltransferase
MSDSRKRFYKSIPERRPPSDPGFFFNYLLAIDFIEENVIPARDYNLLDIGFGSLDFLVRMTQSHANIKGFGCDISVERVEGSPPAERIELRAVDFNDCRDAYPDAFFDFIVAAELIEHLENTDNLVIESSRYLKSGGYLIITTPNLAAWYERILLLIGMEPLMAEVSYCSRTFGKRLLYRLMGRGASPPIGHLRLFTPAALKELCEYHGMPLVKHAGYYTVDFLPNRLISRLYRNMAQGIFMVFQKP